MALLGIRSARLRAFDAKRVRLGRGRAFNPVGNALHVLMPKFVSEGNWLLYQGGFWGVIGRRSSSIGDT